MHVCQSCACGFLTINHSGLLGILDKAYCTWNRATLLSFQYRAYKFEDSLQGVQFMLKSCDPVEASG